MTDVSLVKKFDVVGTLFYSPRLNELNASHTYAFGKLKPHFKGMYGLSRTANIFWAGKLEDDVIQDVQAIFSDADFRGFLTSDQKLLTPIASGQKNAALAQVITDEDRLVFPFRNNPNQVFLALDIVVSRIDLTNLANGPIMRVPPSAADRPTVLPFPRRIRVVNEGTLG